MFAAVLTLLILVRAEALTAAIITPPFHYSFNTEGILQESASSSLSTSPYWWLNSGAELNLLNGRGKTIQGALASTDPWRLTYLASSPVDTDNGYHPQNIFRMVSRSKWQNFNQSVYFNIKKDQLSLSPNRAEHNGLLLMSRYISGGDTLYYSGVRVDGEAIIKKKLNGKYYTLVSEKIFSGTYNRLSKPSLLPKNTWIGLKTEIRNIGSRVNIKLYMDLGWTGNWVKILETTDSSSPILSEGYTGIRTDFMDVEFDSYRITKFYISDIPQKLQLLKQ